VALSVSYRAFTTSFSGCFPLSHIPLSRHVLTKHSDDSRLRLPLAINKVVHKIHTLHPSIALPPSLAVPLRHNNLYDLRTHRTVRQRTRGLHHPSNTHNKDLRHLRRPLFPDPSRRRRHDGLIIRKIRIPRPKAPARRSLRTAHFLWILPRHRHHLPETRFESGKNYSVSRCGKWTWIQLFWLLIAAAAVIIVRCVYRVIEFAQGYNGYLITHEIWMWVGDSTPMCLVQTAFHVVHAGDVFLTGGLIQVPGHEEEAMTLELSSQLHKIIKMK
jgi:hypothetical protein